MKKENGNENNAHVGLLMRQVRELRGMSQAELARKLKTSQSAVARMEQGGQNFGTPLLEKISHVLGRKIMAVSSNMDFAIRGGAALRGEVTINRSKNGAMGLLAASLLNRGTTILHGIPRVEETARMRELLASLGVSVRDLGTSSSGRLGRSGSFEIKVPKEISFSAVDAAAATKMRSTLMLLGGLASRKAEFTLPNAGGCIMGDRTSIAHVRGLEALGIKVSESGRGRASGSARGGLQLDASRKRAGEVVLYEMSDTATENILIAAAGIPGTTKLRFAASNYMVQDVCGFLRALGVGVDGIGTATLTVDGCAAIERDVEYWNSEDPTEAMFFLSIAAVTKSHLFLRRCPIDFLQLELVRLRDMGLRFKVGSRYKSDNGLTDLVDIEVFPSTAKAPLRASPIKIHAQPYPGINTDNLPFFVPIATQAAGTTLIHDWMWENRAIYFTELNRLGAKVRLADPHRVFVEGPTPLTGAQVVCPPALRPATMILVAMLAAEGESVLRNVYSINRGYEDIVTRLRRLGAKIEVLS